MGTEPNPGGKKEDRALSVGTVLYVEDDLTVRSALAEVLETLGGHKVLVAGDGPEALRLLEDAGAVDLLLADIILPGGMNGVELAKTIQQSRPGTRVLLMTAYLEEELGRRGITRNGFPVLYKPVPVKELAGAIGKVLESGNEG